MNQYPFGTTATIDLQALFSVDRGASYAASVAEDFAVTAYPPSARGDDATTEPFELSVLEIDETGGAQADVVGTEAGVWRFVCTATVLGKSVTKEHAIGFKESSV